jgi:hypothetical protein
MTAFRTLGRAVSCLSRVARLAQHGVGVFRLPRPALSSSESPCEIKAR